MSGSGPSPSATSSVKSAEETLHLREDVRVEPLVGGFRAWTQLIPPHNFAINVVAKHIPQLEAEAEGSAEAAELLERTRVEQADVIAFAAAMREVDRLLAERADGGSLEALYEAVPEPLKGYVELVYDRAGNASTRFLEGLLYESPFAHEDLQALEIRPLAADDQEMKMRTPRLPRPGVWQRRLPFRSPAWDVIGRARTTAVSRHEIERLLGDGEELESFFTPAPPSREAASPVREGLRARFFGHACVLFESERASVLVDPLVVPRPAASGRRSFPELPERIDCIAITHGHMDHLDIETLLQLRHRTGTVVVPRNRTGNVLDPSLGLVLRALGFADVREVHEMERVPLPGGEIFAVPFMGEHADLDIVAKSAYAIALGGRVALCSADARNLAPQVFDHVRRLAGRVHAAFLGMECEGSPLSLAHGPFLAGPVSPEVDETRRTNGNDAAGALAIVDSLGCPAAYVYAMGFEPWLAFMFGVPDETRQVALCEIETFMAGCEERGTSAELLEDAHDVIV